jgi:hypothetical protein
MGISYSCPTDYEMLKQSVYRSSVRICLHKQMIGNTSVITDISNPVETSGAYQAEKAIEVLVILVFAIGILISRPS